MFLLARENRLKKNRDFKNVFNKGKSIAGLFVVIYWLPNKLSLNRFGFSVSKKVGNAVFRNRIKRILRAILSKDDKIEKGYDIIIIVRPKIKGISTPLVEKDLKKVLIRAKVYHN